MANFFAQKADRLELYLKVTPGASRTETRGEKDGRLRCLVAAAPEDGKANAALIAFFAQKFKLAKSAISLSAGQKSRLKTLSLPAGNAQLPALLEELRAPPARRAL